MGEVKKDFGQAAGRDSNYLQASLTLLVADTRQGLRGEAKAAFDIVAAKAAQHPERVDLTAYLARVEKASGVRKPASNPSPGPA